MAIYSKNRQSSIGNIHVEAAEGYEGTIGVQLAMIEGYQEDFQIFDSSIRKDFEEVTLTLEGASEEEVSAVQESAIGDILTRIKEFFVKLLAKIKSIFRSFMAKFDSHVMKSNLEFFNKYKKDVYGKEFGKMKIKYSSPKAGVLDGAAFVYSAAGSTPAVNSVCMNVQAISTATDLDKIIEDFDKDEYICNVLNGCIPSTSISSVKEYAKEFHEKCFEDEEELDGAQKAVDESAAILSKKKDPIEAVKKVNASLERAISEMIRSLEKSKDEVLKHVIPDGNKSSSDALRVTSNYDSDLKDGRYVKSKGTGDAWGTKDDRKKKIQRAVNYVHQQAMAIQEASGKFTTATLTETKFLVAQARRVFAAAVHFNPKSVKESALMMEVAQEAAVYEVLSELD